MTKEQKKSAVLETLAQPLPGIPEPVLDAKGDPVPPGVVQFGNSPSATVTTHKKPRKPRAPKPEKPPRKKAQGKYGVFVSGKVTGADGQILEVLVPEQSLYGSHAAARDSALEIAKSKPGVVVRVHRLLDRFVLQEVTKVTLVRS